MKAMDVLVTCCLPVGMVGGLVLGGVSALGAIGCSASLGDSPAPGDFENAGEPGAGTETGLRRLTRYEYAATVSDLLGVEVDPDQVPREQLVRGHSVIAAEQRVGYDDVDSFLALGLQIGDEVAPALLANASCTEPACLGSFLDDLLTRAFRETPSDAVRARYAALLESEDAGATLEARLGAVIGAVLSSPRFLHRREVSADGSASPGAHQLSGTSIATRLSYLVWQGGPDAELLALAERGELTDAATRQRELERLLADPRARRGARGFAREWLSAFDNRVTSKNTSLLADLPDDAAAEIEESFGLTVDDALFGVASAGGAPQGRLGDLLSTSRFFGGEAMTKLLGAEAVPAGSPLLQPAGPRQGLLTHPFVLAAHTKESGASPFPLGKFVFESLLCEEIPPPPPNIPLVAEDDASGLTLRQRLEAVTSEVPCSNCHDRIGPPGFAFLPFDPLGRYREADGAGAPWDTSGTLRIGQDQPSDDEGRPWVESVDLSFTDTAEMLGALAAAEAVQVCAARRLFRFAYGRFEAEAEAAPRALAQAVVEAEGAWAAALGAVVTAPEFIQMRLAP